MWVFFGPGFELFLSSLICIIAFMCVSVFCSLFLTVPWVGLLSVMVAFTF